MQASAFYMAASIEYMLRDCNGDVIMTARIYLY